MRRYASAVYALVMCPSLIRRLLGPSVGHICESCKNGWTDRDAVWGGDSSGP